MIRFNISGKYQLKPQAVNSDPLKFSGFYLLKPQAINPELAVFNGAYKFPFYPDNRIKKNPDGTFEISPKFPDPDPPLDVPPGGKVVAMAEETGFASSSATAFIPDSDDTYTITEIATNTQTWIAVDGMVRYVTEGLVIRTYGEPFAYLSYSHPSFYTSYTIGYIPYLEQRNYIESYSVIFYDNDFRRNPDGTGTRTSGYNYSFSVSGGCLFS